MNKHPEGMATIGKVIKTHGVRGGLKVYPYSDFPERVSELKRVFLQQGQEVTEHQVEDAFVHGRFWVLSLKDVESADSAAGLRGALVKIPLSERVPLPEGSYYLDEIVGLEVYDETMGHLGRVTDVLQYTANDVYVVNTIPAGGEKPVELLIPALKSVVREIDTVNKKMTVKLPDGLL